MRGAALAAAMAMAACAAPAPRAPALVLPGSDGRAHDLADTRGARAVVVTFFSSTCPCQAAHDARLRALAERWAPRGVTFVAIDADADATPARDAAEARARRYPFPILTDPRGASADALGATVATYSVVVDASGLIRYRGGIDSDWMKLTDHPDPWLDDAIAATLGGERGPPPAEHRALGCSIRRP